MNITFALMLVSIVAQNQYCHLQVGCVRYNCIDFTKDAVLLLRQNNFTAYPMLGWKNHIYHAWVGLKINGTLYNIEPQTGEIVYSTLKEGEFPTLEREDSYYFGRRGIVRGVV